MTRVGVWLGLLCVVGCDAEDGIANTGNDVEVEVAEDGVCECPLDDAGIYMLTDSGEIWTYDPRTGCFDFVLRAHCGARTDFFSLAVSRHGRAWVQFADDEDFYTVDLEDPEGTCRDPGFESEDELICAANVAFVREGAGDACDRMYLYSAPKEPDRGQFAVMSPRTLELSQFDVGTGYNYGDLTGTPDGRLFGLVRAPEEPRIREYDKHTGEVLTEVRIPELDDLWTGSLSYWGGMFYIYAHVDEAGEQRMLLEYDYFDLRGRGRVVTTIVEQMPFYMAAAAVSPCAPAAVSAPRTAGPSCSRL